MRYLYLLLPIFLFAINLQNNSVYKDIKKEYGLKSHNNYMVESNLYIVGFSKDSLIEYVIQKPNEARDEEVAVVFVQNMVTDKIVYKSKEITFKSSFESMLKANRDFIKKVANKFDILEGDFKLKEFPLNYKSYKFKTRVESKYIYSKEFNEKFLSSVKIFMDRYNKNLKATKVIYKTNHKPQEWIYDYRVLGFIKSPFEDRVVVVAAQIQRGWEGPPSVINLKLIGSSLTKGF